jgi:hypothetical protein
LERFSAAAGRVESVRRQLVVVGEAVDVALHRVIVALFGALDEHDLSVVVLKEKKQVKKFDF